MNFWHGSPLPHFHVHRFHGGFFIWESTSLSIQKNWKNETFHLLNLVPFAIANLVLAQSLLIFFSYPPTFETSTEMTLTLYHFLVGNVGGVCWHLHMPIYAENFFIGNYNSKTLLGRSVKMKTYQWGKVKVIVCCNKLNKI